MSSLPVEIAFLERHGIRPETLRHAAEVASRVGSTADTALLKEGLVSEETFYRALAEELRLPFLSDVELDPSTQYPHNVLVGIAPVKPGNIVARVALAPAGERLAWLLARPRQVPAGLAIVTPTVLTRAVMRAQAAEIANAAANELADAMPHLSIRSGASLSQCMLLVASAAPAGFLATLEPGLFFGAVTVALGLVYLGMVIVRLAAAQTSAAITPPWTPRWSERSLPVYTIIVPLCRERRVLPRLVRALSSLDYPAPKLDIKLVIEEDDAEMHAALAEVALPAFFEVLTAPRGLPRTKPRALNVALPLARGDFTVIYDAEDVPQPDQLRLAVATFARCPGDVACLQARLVIDNEEDGWLPRLFTIEYAMLFDVINPALAVFDIPVPLGGTSNHFRTDVLRSLHGWDAWNVTEDADLGIRLALAGYRVADLPSSTLEEAPIAPRAWLRQRTRWMKGFMQVCITHSRRPIWTWRKLGPGRFLGALTVTLGTVVTTLAYPLFAALALVSILDGSLLQGRSPGEALWSGIAITLFASGFAAMIAPAVIGLTRRNWWHLLPYVALVPLYYALISIAAWRGLAELILDPHGWHKTEHGLARTSRSGALMRPAATPSPPRSAGERG